MVQNYVFAIKFFRGIFVTKGSHLCLHNKFPFGLITLWCVSNARLEAILGLILKFIVARNDMWILKLVVFYLI